MDIRWTTAMLDVPLDTYPDTTRFWCAVTGSTMSARRGQGGEFQTLLPQEGETDAFLRSQRHGENAARVHLDLHVRDAAALRAALAEALRLGAVLTHDAGDVVVLASPGGAVFCLVDEPGPRRRPHPVAGALVDQVCLDVPASSFDTELAFWPALTGWHPTTTTPGADLVPLHRPPDLPLRLLLQRLGDDPRTGVTAHLDLACADRAATTSGHVALGARVRGHGPRWTTLVDPAGLVYCLTDRDPVTGLLPAPAAGKP